MLMIADTTCPGERGGASRLRFPDKERLRTEVQESPRHLGYREETWSGSLLARHLRQRYRVAFTDRRCRQLLSELGAVRCDRTHPGRDKETSALAPQSREAGSPARVPAQRLLDKNTALRRIRRLAVSGLPLEPFVRALFAIVGATLAMAQCQTLLADPSPPYTGYVLSDPDIASYNDRNRRLVIEGGPKTSGIRNINAPAMLAKPIWRHEEVALPHLYRSAGYNEVQRPLGMHHCMVAMFIEGGCLVGRWPMWRSQGMPDWNREDARFMATAAPFITHGLRAAQATSFDARSANSFVPIQGPGQGAALIDRRGKVLGLDRVARATFSELGAFDERRAEAAAAESVRSGLAYIASVIAKIFDDNGGDPHLASAPLARVWAHHTGIALRLRGFALDGNAHPKQFVVLVERGEFEAHRQQRLMLSYGLSSKEYEVLRLVCRGERRRDIATRVGVSQGTLKTHLARLGEKLEVGSHAELRSRARLLLG